MSFGGFPSGAVGEELPDGFTKCSDAEGFGEGRFEDLE
jgi:hypothetical protein